MKNYKKTMIKRTMMGGLAFYILLTFTVIAAVGGNVAESGNTKSKRIGAKSFQAKEAEKILSAAAKMMKTSKDAFQKNLVTNRFTPEQNVFLPSALAVDFKKRTATLPLYTGIGPGGQPTYLIITEAADVEEFDYKEVAEVLQIPLGTVMSRLNRDRTKLRETLSGVAEEYRIFRATPTKQSKKASFAPQSALCAT